MLLSGRHADTIIFKVIIYFTNFKTGRLVVLWQRLQGSPINLALGITLKSHLFRFQRVLDFMFLTLTFWNYFPGVCTLLSQDCEIWTMVVDFICIHTSTLHNKEIFCSISESCLCWMMLCLFLSCQQTWKISHSHSYMALLPYFFPASHSFMQGW